jgi:hypothetical protein
MRSRTAALKTALTVLKTVRAVLAASLCVDVRLVTQLWMSPGLMPPSVRLSQAGYAWHLRCCSTALAVEGR